MHFVASTLAAASVLVLASAAPESFVFPDAVPLDKRQTSGPKYECHANCGFTIQDSAKEGYCQSDKWKTELSACLDCALEFDIWKWYGDKVSDAAKKCGVDATPKPAKGGESSASVTSAPETAQPETTSQTTQPATTAETSAAPTQPEPTDATTVTESRHETTGAVTSAPSATHSGNSTGTAAPSTVPTAGADTIRPAGIIAGLAMLVAASFL